MNNFKSIEDIISKYDNYDDILNSGFFREATLEERESIEKHLKENSVEIGINFWNELEKYNKYKK